MADHFILPASNFAFGITIPPSSVSLLILLGYERLFQVDHYQIVIPNVGSTFPVGSQVTQGLRLLRFHLSELEYNYLESMESDMNYAHYVI